MTDKERMLMAIAQALASIQYSDTILLENTNFSETRLSSGDILIAVSSGVHEFTVSTFVRYEGSDVIVRELGGYKECKITNDWFNVLRGVRESPLYRTAFYKGDQYFFYEKVVKAFKKGDEYWHQLDRVEFPYDNTARIYVRVKWWASNRTDEENIASNGPKNGYRPFHFDMPFLKKTTITSILEQLIAHGYGKEAATHNS